LENLPVATEICCGSRHRVHGFAKESRRKTDGKSEGSVLFQRMADTVFAGQHEIRRDSGVVVQKRENLVVDDVRGEIIKEVVKEMGHFLGSARVTVVTV